MPALSEPRFSVLMSVYYRETASNLRQALDSILSQTLPPHEIVLVKDGPLSRELDDTLHEYHLKHFGVLKLVEIPVNRGLGNALGVGLKHCTYDVVARMDTDDIAVKDRFEQQIIFLLNHPEVDILGSNIEEFNQVPGDLKRFKVNPETHQELISQIKLKSPFNHPSIVFRKQAVMKAGNYDGSLPLFEDYGLFIRLMLSGARFHNLQEVLLNFRVNDGLETIKRRSGMLYLRKELKFVNWAVKAGAFTQADRLIYIALKFPVRLMPPKMVLWIYNRFLRK